MVFNDARSVYQSIMKGQTVSKYQEVQKVLTESEYAKDPVFKSGEKDSISGLCKRVTRSRVHVQQVANNPQRMGQPHNPWNITTDSM